MATCVRTTSAQNMLLLFCFVATSCNWVFGVSVTPVKKDGSPKKPIPAKVGKDDAKDDKGGWSEKKNPEGKVVQELKIEAPSMTEEDQYGYNMPPRYACDSCKAVLFHLNQDLKKVHPKSRRMKQWEYTDAFDKTCKDAFEGYGIKLHNGENALSGPGIPIKEEISPGMGAIQMGGDSWKKRLTEVCKKTVYEKIGEGEETLYELLYQKFQVEANGGEEDSNFANNTCIYQTRDCKTEAEQKKEDVKKVAEKAKAEKKKQQKEEKEGKAAKLEKSKKDAEKAAKKEKAATEKKEKKNKNENEKTVSPIKEAPVGSKGDKVNLMSYMEKLARSHDLSSDDYVMSRTEKDWDKLMLSIAGKIFNYKAEL